jgi:chromosome segregation ATPase
MDQDQILKQVEWLDEERRRDKDNLAKQEERILALEGSLDAAHKEIKNLGGEITRLSAIIARMDRFDDALSQHRVEFSHQLEEIAKDGKKREAEMEKVRRVEMRAVDSSVADIRKELESIAGLKLGLQARIDEEMRLGRSIDELRTKIQDMRRGEEENLRTYKLIEDGRRQDSKRLVDLQGEAVALRKRQDEDRGKIEVVSSNIKKIEARLSELTTMEAERRDSQASFLDKQAMLQVERDRIWKEWATRFDMVERQSSGVESQLQAMDATHRTVKRAQESLDELTQRVERRMNEITEMQRLSEERFRQEWVTFKADDQKRWTNYTLTQEEQRGETGRTLERLGERVTHLDDGLQELQDLLYQVNEYTEKRLQGLLALAHDWVEEYEHSLSHIR